MSRNSYRVNSYRVRERDWSDLRCATVVASTPQHAAEVYVECREKPYHHGDVIEVVVIDNNVRHNIEVRVSLVPHFDARKPRDLQKEQW